MVGLASGRRRLHLDHQLIVQRRGVAVSLGERLEDGGDPQRFWRRPGVKLSIRALKTSATTWVQGGEDSESQGRDPKCSVVL